MKKSQILTVVLLFVSCAVAFSQKFTGDTWNQVKKDKKGKIVVTYTKAPKFSDKVNGKYSGICFDILKDFSAYLKQEYGVTLTIEYKDLSNTEDFDLLLNTVSGSKGGVIGLGDITITSERKKVLKFSDPYFNTVAILATNNGRSLTSLPNIAKDFAGMKAIVQNGTTHEVRLQKIKKDYFPSLVIETTTGFDEANNKVITNDKYFTYVDISTYFNVLDKKLSMKRHPAGDQKGESFGFIMPKTSDWDAILNEFFSSNGGYTNSTEYRKILSENMGNKVLNLIDNMNKQNL